MAQHYAHLVRVQLSTHDADQRACCETRPIENRKSGIEINDTGLTGEQQGDQAPGHVMRITLCRPVLAYAAQPNRA
jgi:hypothetical protein